MIVVDPCGRLVTVYEMQQEVTKLWHRTEDLAANLEVSLNQIHRRIEALEAASVEAQEAQRAKDKQLRTLELREATMAKGCKQRKRKQAASEFTTKHYQSDALEQISDLPIRVDGLEESIQSIVQKIGQTLKEQP